MPDKSQGSWKINDDFTIKQDGRYWAVEWFKDGFNKNGKPIRAIQRFYPGTLHQACQSIIDRSAHDALDLDSTDLEQVMNKIEEVSKELAEMIKNVKLWRDTDVEGRW